MEREALRAEFDATRGRSVSMADRLTPAEWRIQSMPDVSPPWWNLGHTSWFFARNLLRPLGRGTDGDAALDYLLNSYYESLGPRLPRDRRGSVSRPSNEEVLAYRESVDARVRALLDGAAGDAGGLVEEVVAVGIQHEQQHQELMVTEIKHIRSGNPRALREPLVPRPAEDGDPPPASPPAWLTFEGGLLEFGNVEGGWCWDVETPVHRAFLVPFAIRDRPVTNGEFAAFAEDGGYGDPLLWLSNGWEARTAGGWTAPLYWEREGNGWTHWTLQGHRPVDPEEPAVHVSFHEAHAFAAWAAASGGDRAGARLPTEREWEHAARASGAAEAGANLLDSGLLHPARPRAGGGPGFLGDVWEWTASHFEPYPGYRPWQGALAEYNGKFMDNQRVLRGGSAATPAGHVRVSYRNFWPAPTRFQFSGVRLARDA